MSITLKFKIKTVRSAQLIEKRRDLVKQILVKTATDIEATAKSLAPVDTGFLRNSIQVDLGDIQELRARVKVGAEYGRFVEFGTRKMAAQPYLTPAVEQHRAAFKAAMNQVVTKGR